MLDEIVPVDDTECFLIARDLVGREGLYAGDSSGAAVAGAVKYARQIGKPHNIVVLLPDGAARYFSKLFDDEWLHENGFLEDEWGLGKVADLLEHREITVIAATPTQSVRDVIAKLKAHSISQLPVVAAGKSAGAGARGGSAALPGKRRALAGERGRGAGEKRVCHGLISDTCRTGARPARRRSHGHRPRERRNRRHHHQDRPDRLRGEATPADRTTTCLSREQDSPRGRCRAALPHILPDPSRPLHTGSRRHSGRHDGTGIRDYEAVPTAGRRPDTQTRAPRGLESVRRCPGLGTARRSGRVGSRRSGNGNTGSGSVSGDEPGAPPSG